MGDSGKLRRMLSTSRGPGEVQDWIFSLTPVGVAFVFYVIFILSADLEPKGEFIAYGAAAGFIGLESYWIQRGWRNNHFSTVVLGFIGVALALFALGLYLSMA
jgi:hypothetical protein